MCELQSADNYMGIRWSVQQILIESHVLVIRRWTRIYAPTVSLVMNGWMVSIVASETENYSNTFLSCFANPDCFPFLFLLFFFSSHSLYYRKFEIEGKEKKKQCFGIMLHLYNVSLWFFFFKPSFGLNFSERSPCHHRSALTWKK